MSAAEQTDQALGNEAVATACLWPPGDGEAADLVRRIDWSRTPLGPSHRWPASLRATVTMVLDSQLPMLALWGPRFVQIYNDGYRTVLGDRHPAAMGTPQADCWPENWQASESIYRCVMSDGRAARIEDQPFPIGTHESPRTCFMTVDYGPIRDADGNIRGVLVTLVDTTRRVLAEQRTAQLLSGSGSGTGAVLTQLSQLFEQAPGFAAVLRGADHVFEMANEAYYQLVGRRVLLGRPLLEALPEFDEMGLGGLLDDVLRTGRPFVARSMRTLLRHGSGSPPAECWIDFVFQPLVEADGSISGVFMQGHDVSERKQAEDALRERNQRLAVLYDTARAMLAAEQPMEFLERIYGRLADLLGLNVYLHHCVDDDGGNLRLTAFEGLTAEQVDRLARCPPAEAMHAKVAGTREAVVVDNVQHSTDQRLSVLRSIGLRAYVCEPLIARGQLVGTLSLGSTVREALDDNALGTIRAISQLVAVAIERQRTRAALRDSEERFRSVFSHAAVGIAVTDATGRFLHANDAFCRLIGRSESELRRLDFGALAHPDDRERDLSAVGQVLAGGMQSALIHTRFLGRDGRVVWAQASIAAVRDDQGRPQSLISMIEDVSERMEAEMQLARADRTRSEFLAMLAHELRNPMAPLRNAIALMERGDVSGKYTPALIAIMHRQVDQLSRLVGDLLEVSRINEGKIELRIAPMALSQALESAVEAVQPMVDERRQTLHVEPATSAWIDGDACRISQVVTNLLNNAVKFTPEGGRIELSVDDREPEQVAIVVRDNGVGITSDLLPHVFELFEQGHQTIDRSQGGLGIGLALVRQLVHMHGGTVEACSEGAGKGSTFVVRLPRRSAG